MNRIAAPAALNGIRSAREHGFSKQLLRTSKRPSTTRANRPLQPAMKRLTPLEHARTRDKTITMSTTDRGPEARARTIAWLEQRPSDGWFYASGDNFSFSTSADANAFKQRLMAEMTA